MGAPDMTQINAAVRDSEWYALKNKAREIYTSKRTGQALYAKEPEGLLLPYQAELFGALELNDVVIIEKGRRTGFTWGVAAKASLVAAASKTARGMNVFYVGYNREMAREFVDVGAMWARAFASVASAIEDYVFEYEDERGEKHAIKAFRISFASGFSIIALPSKPRSLRGMQGLVIIDEAAFHDDLEEVMKAALALLMWGGRIVVISTHDGKDNYFNTLVEEARNKTKDYGFMRVDFGRAISEGLYKRICLVTNKEWSPDAEKAWQISIEGKYGAGADEELYCIPRADSAIDIFIPRSLVDTAIARPLPEVNAQALVMGVDVARFGDDKSSIYFRRGRDARSIQRRLYEKRSTTELAREVVMLHNELQPQAIFIDGTGVGGGVVDAVGMFGVDCIDINFASKSPDPMYANMRTYMYAELKKWLYTGCLPDNTNLAREISAAKYVVTRVGNREVLALEPKADIKKRLGYSPDEADALALTFPFPIANVDPAAELIEKMTVYDPRDLGGRGSYDPRN